MAARILVVEDELVLNRSLVQQLAREGFSAEGVRSAAEARAVMDDDWDLMLLDMRLPDSQGLGLLKEVLERKPEQLVIGMTAYSSVENAVEAIKVGSSRVDLQACKLEYSIVSPK